MTRTLDRKDILLIVVRGRDRDDTDEQIASALWSAISREPGQWAWGTIALGWPDQKNNQRILVEWTGRAWRGVEVRNVWSSTQIVDVEPVDRPADPAQASVSASKDANA